MTIFIYVDYRHYLRFLLPNSYHAKIFKTSISIILVPPEFSNLPDDQNNYSLFFNVFKRPSFICRSCFLMTLVFADIYGDWQKDYWRFEGKYVMCGWGLYESIKLAQEIFTELEMSVRKISRKSKQTFPLDNKGGIVIGIKYGFISILKEQGFRRAVDFDFSAVDRMKKGRENNKDLAICDHPLWPISIKDFWNGFDEGRLLAERILNEWQV